ERNLGLSNVLVQKASLDSVIQATGVRNLDVITSGVLPPNPAEMLGSNRMQELIDALRQRYDLCLFDTPPLIAVTDAAVLGKMLDGVLLVVKAGQTRRDAVRRGMELLHHVNARVLGVLLNNVTRQDTYGSYYYYYDYYYYGDSDAKLKKRHHSRSKNRGLKAKTLTFGR
ncbi:MAG: polysaccharide biosynthesis tyrosine autokinase, partial [Calditrichaeota bacterium]